MSVGVWLVGFGWGEGFVKKSYLKCSVFSAAGIGIDIHELEEKEVILLGTMYLSHSLFYIVGGCMDVGT